MQLINDISDSAYANLEGVNFSSFKEFFVSPYHYRWSMANPRKETDALVVGLAFHCAVLQPDKFYEKFAVAPKVDRRKTEDKLIWNEFVEASKGKTVLTDEQFALILQCASAVKDNKFFKAVFDKNDELYIEAGGNCEFAGSIIKGRIDLYNATKNIIIDLKSINKLPTERAMKQVCYDRMYYMQSFFYAEIIKQRFNLDKHPTAVYAYVHKSPPHTVGLSQFSSKFMDKAASELSKQLCRYENCKKSDLWPEAEQSVSPVIIEPYDTIVIDNDEESDDTE